MEKLQCTNCGAPLRPDGVCEYCGSRYKIVQQEGVPPFLIQTYQAPVRRMVCETKVPHYLRAAPPEVLASHAKSELVRHMVDGLTDYFKISIREDPTLEATIIRGEIRVVPPDFRF